MRVLLTRSELQNAVFQQLIESQCPELTTVEVPMLVQVPIDSKGTQLDEFLRDVVIDDAIFISPSSVEFGAKNLIQKLNLRRYFTVGKGTATLLDKQQQTSHTQEQRQQDFEVIFPVNSAGSLALLDLPELQQVNNKSLMIVTGTQGKPLLEQTLLDRGAKVSRWECYQREKPINLSNNLKKASQLSVHYMMLHSAHAAQNFIQAIDEAQEKTSFDETIFIVGAQSIAKEFANSIWIKQVVIADSPMPNDMLKCLINNLNVK